MWMCAMAHFSLRKKKEASTSGNSKCQTLFIVHIISVYLVYYIVCYVYIIPNQHFLCSFSYTEYLLLQI